MFVYTRLLSLHTGDIAVTPIARLATSPTRHCNIDDSPSRARRAICTARRDYGTPRRQMVSTTDERIACTERSPQTGTSDKGPATRDQRTSSTGSKGADHELLTREERHKGPTCSAQRSVGTRAVQRSVVVFTPVRLTPYPASRVLSPSTFSFTARPWLISA
ncbi:hypothetical protein L596_006382 [Steinernema carpocapsae]|uniref:Uncharacterized protein n=1 Tax=Steinernema carpocapsae TaxID=34508 RepID=A0A4U8V3T9_STECR|nr:hypothetical protein L596_006382 [Steinernema carpocapsae]